MATFIAFVVANWAAILAPLILIILSLFTAIFNKNEKAKGIIGIFRSIIERSSGLQPANSAGTLKVPGMKAGPKTEPTPIFSE